jgi:dolichol-phosphate mannosyltransferase
VSDWSLARRIISRGAQLVGLVLLPEVLDRVSDPMSGYFLLDRRAIAGKTLHPSGYKILIEVLARGDVRSIAEIGYVFRERAEGRSKATATVYLQYVWHLLRLRAAWLREARFVRFAVVGLSGVVVDMAILYLLSDPRTLHWGLTRSKLIAAEAAMVNNYLWNDAWTFADFVGAERSPRRKFHRFLKFNAICGVGLVLNIVLLNIQFNWMGMNRYTANAVAIAAATMWNYLINKRMGCRSTD